jgi:hypothetical protein
MTPTALVSTVVADRSRCWLLAGRDGVRPEQAMALRHEPQDGGRASSNGHPNRRIACNRMDRRMTRELDGSPPRRPRQRNPHRAR